MVSANPSGEVLDSASAYSAGPKKEPEAAPAEQPAPLVKGAVPSTSESDYSNKFRELIYRYYRLMMDDIEKEKIAALPSQLLITTICHPMEYAKVLIQIGYEPLPPRRSTTLFGRPAMILPNVFQYIKYIKTQDGFFGCYKGLSARILGLIASSQLSTKLIYATGIHLPELEDPPNIVTDEAPKMEDYIKLGRRDMIMHTASVIVSYPFHVVSVRMMASFVGKEEEYSSLVGAIVSVYRDDGIKGFFHGLIPKLLADLTCVAMTGMLAYYVNKYIIKTKDLRYYTVPLLTFITSTLTYPLVVVSTCMAVAGSSLQAGNPPSMPKYPSWQSCWYDLAKNKQHKRGSSLIFRYYIAPISATQFN